MNEVHAIVDMQYGSCGKGLFAGYLAEKLQPDVIVTAWGPNAGHTFIGRDGVKDTNIMLPNGIRTSQRLKAVLLGPGSIINPAILMAEFDRYKAIMEPIQFLIHEAAAVVQDVHRQREAEYGFAIGSTMKGVGEATIDKIRRSSTQAVAKGALRGTPLERFVCPKWVYDQIIDGADKVLIEGAQGFSLGVNSGFYPYCTSRECTIWQLLSDCQIPAHVGKMHVYGVARTYPIRVANRFAWDLLSKAGHAMGGCAHAETAYKEGIEVCLSCGTAKRQVGTSGPCYEDQHEIQWSDLGLEPELTTVTKLPRRVFTFSAEQVRQAVRANGIQKVFLNFCNYDVNGDGRDVIADVEGYAKLREKIDAIERTGARVKWTGWGPTINDVQEAF